MVSRRSFLTTTGVLAASILQPGALHAEEGAVSPPATPADALQRLRAGNERFTSGRPLGPQRDLSRLRTIAPQQTPFAAFLGCADSRVPVELVYDQGFGDLFVVRVAGNIATSVEIASLEYGTLVLGAKVLIVLGHSNCGAVSAALERKEVPGQISTLYQHIVPAFDRKDLDLDAAIVANVIYQARKLKKGSTVIARLIKEGTLTLAGGVVDLHTGTVRPVEV